MRRSSNLGEALAVAAKACDVMKINPVLADPSEEITQKTVQEKGIATTDKRGPCVARLQVKAEQHALQWIDGLDKTGSNYIGDEDLNVKPGGDEPV